MLRSIVTFILIFWYFSDHICQIKFFARCKDGIWTCPAYPSVSVEDTLNRQARVMCCAPMSVERGSQRPWSCTCSSIIAVAATVSPQVFHDAMGLDIDDPSRCKYRWHKGTAFLTPHVENAPHTRPTSSIKKWIAATDCLCVSHRDSPHPM